MRDFLKIGETSRNKEKGGKKMRLIDANYLIELANQDGAYGYVDAWDIAHAPTVDAVEVVRCKDCKHQGNDEECPFCNWCGERLLPYGDWFCAYGKRKEA